MTVRSGNTEQVSEWVFAHEAELGLIEGPPAHKELTVEHFLDDRLLLIVPHGHAWAGKQLTLAALAAEPLLMRERGSGTRRVIEQALKKAGTVDDWASSRLRWSWIRPRPSFPA